MKPYRIKPHYLKVLAFDYVPPTDKTAFDKPIIDFTYAIGRNLDTHEKMSVNFRWIITITKKGEQVLNFIAEQRFDFIDPIHELKEHNIKYAINEAALQLEIEYEKHSVIHDDMLRKLTIVRPNVASLILSDLQP